MFGGLFGSGASRRRPLRLPPPPAPVAPPPSAPEPVQVAATEPFVEPVRPPAEVPIRRPREAVPLPPPRPFDLGAAKTPSVAAQERPARPPAAAAVLPPKRPELHASAEKALYFSDPASDGVTRLTGGAFDRVKPARRADVDN